MYELSLNWDFSFGKNDAHTSDFVFDDRQLIIFCLHFTLEYVLQWKKWRLDIKRMYEINEMTKLVL